MKLLAVILNKLADFRGKSLTKKLSWTMICVVKQYKLSSTIMKNLNKLKMNDSWWKCKIVGGQREVHVSTIMDYRQLSSTIMGCLTRASEFKTVMMMVKQHQMLKTKFEVHMKHLKVLEIWLMMKCCLCLQNFSSLWNLFPWVSMGNRFGCYMYFRKLYIFSL